MRWFVPTARAKAAILLAIVSVSGCGAARTTWDPHPEVVANSRTTTQRVQILELSDRPKLVLVRRQGDPLPAGAVSVMQDFGPFAASQLARLVTRRLRAKGFADLVSRPHPWGFQIAASLAPKSVARFSVEVHRALSQPFSKSELKAAITAPVSAPAELFGARACAFTRSPAGPERLTLKQLESYRKRAYASEATALAFVGDEKTLTAAREGAEEAPEWPSGTPPEDRWPEQDSIQVVRSELSDAKLSFGLLSGLHAETLAAVRLLSDSKSTLYSRLHSLSKRLQVTQIAFVAKPRGSCLAVELDFGSEPPIPELVEYAARAVIEEARQALTTPTMADWLLADNVLRPHDPREAAGNAAWLALTQTLEADEPRVGLVLSVPGSAEPSDRRGFERALRSALTPLSTDLKVRVRVEQGQSEVWALLASPCGTRGETTLDAGLTALTIYALASGPRRDGVSVEAWVSADGVGLLAHAPRAHAGETPNAQIARVVTELARRFVAKQLNGVQMAAARGRLLSRLGGEPRTGYPELLDGLSGNRPTLLQPLGTFRSVSDLTLSQGEARRSDLLRRPLSLAVIVNDDREQAATARRVLASWLKPIRNNPAKCPATGRATPTNTLVELESDDAVPVAYVGARLPRMSDEAMATALLLNRQAGWVHEALVSPGLASSARAYVLGGSKIAALILEVRAANGDLDSAVAQARGLLARLADGAARSEDLTLAKSLLDTMRQESALDPRHRIVKLWQGPHKPSRLTLKSLRSMHRALRGDAHQVVMVRPRPADEVDGSPDDQ